jgi:hypothetical protein
MRIITCLFKRIKLLEEFSGTTGPNVGDSFVLKLKATINPLPE